MGDVKQEITVNDRSFQYNTTQEICKNQVRWCHKGPRIMYYLDRIIERKLNINGIYYWWFVNGDPYTFQPTLIIQECHWITWIKIRWQNLSVHYRKNSGQVIGQVQ